MIRQIISLWKAWRTQEPADWAAFADHLRTFQERFPNSYLLRLAMANALRLGECYRPAVDMFETAIKMSPARGRAFLGLGQAYRALGHREAAIAAFERALTLGQRKAGARQLCRYASRDRLPEQVSNIFPLSQYESYLEAHPVGHPPSSLAAPVLIHVCIKGNGRGEETATTLNSVRNQGYNHWSLIQDVAVLPDDVWVLRLQAGAVLVPEAMSWFAWAIQNTPGEVAYCDHDRYELDEEGALRRSCPVLQPMCDPIWFAGREDLPALLIRGRLLGLQGELSASEILAHSRVAHIPRILASTPLLSPAPPAPPQIVPPTRHEGIISVIIPTKDNITLLQTCIDRLISTASQPTRIEFILVDNSLEDGALAYTLKLPDRCTRSIIPFQRGFNWSAANNLGASAARGTYLLFLNDDTEMVSAHWDDILIGRLNRTETGIVGARMHYPNGLVQHAGFIFGLDIGPQHEGRWMPETASGPDHRWSRARRAVAVTGAFMGMRRDLFEEIGGFDEVTYEIDFSDLDLCLDVRARGYDVVYEPGLLLIHHESASRGYNRSRAKRRRASKEAARFRAKWGEAAQFDPGYNPHWSRLDASFDGYRAVSRDEILQSIKRSVADAPWKVIRPDR